MKVLVTGSEGYIGTRLVQILQEEGHTVVGLDAGYFADCLLYEPGPRAAFLRKDVRDVSVKDLEGIEIVCHLAALSNDPLGNIDPDLTHEINTVGSLRVAEAAKQVGVKRFIFSSSCSMYGDVGAGDLTEDHALLPLTPYAKSKVDTEDGLRNMADDGFSPVFLRNATAYGVTGRLRVDLVLNNLAAWAWCTGKVLILSDGTPWRPVVHVDDICAAFSAAIKAPRDDVHNQAFNVGRDSENYQVKDLAYIVQRAAPESEVEIAGEPTPNQPSYKVNFNKIKRCLPDFQAKWTAEKGVKQLLDAYERYGFVRDDLDADRFTRLKRIQAYMDSGDLNSELRWAPDLSKSMGEAG